MNLHISMRFHKFCLKTRSKVTFQFFNNSSFSKLFFDFAQKNSKKNLSQALSFEFFAFENQKVISD